MSKEKIKPGVQKWLDHISTYEREFKKWESRVEKILKRYRDESRSTNRQEARFNILWSNVQTLVPAVFSRMPRPEVTRRFNDPDPVGRLGSLLLERGLDYEVGHYPDFKATLRQAVYDRFLGGRGTAWIRYEPHMKAARLQLPTDGVEISEDSDEPNEELDYECAPIDYVHWKDFGHTIGRTWEEVTAVWRCVYLSKAAAKERFGEVADKLSYDKTPEDLKAYGKPEEQHAAVYEIWDKTTQKAYWLSKGLKQILDEKDDPLGLEEFFPCPRPLYATLTNESLIPVPDFSLYQDQANELDILCDRIDGLIKALQIKGVYDGAITELGRLFTEGENGTLIPVKNWAAFAEKNGLKGSLEIVDLDPIARALKEAYMAFEMVKQQVYEITGLSDIIRGETNPEETATAQQIKGQYASLRLRNMQTDVAAFAAEIMQLKAQVICNKFDPQTIMAISAAEQLDPVDIPGIPQAMSLLLGERLQNPDSNAPNPMRSFRVEVATDSMIQIDEQEEKKARSEFLTSVAAYMKNIAPVMIQVPPLAPIIMELLKFTAQGFRAGRAIEGKFDQVTKAVIQQANAPKPPDPEQQKLQAEMQKMQAEVQADREERSAEMQAMREEHALKMKELEAKIAGKQQEAQIKKQVSMDQLMAKREENQLKGQDRRQNMMFNAVERRQQAMQPKQNG